MGWNAPEGQNIGNTIQNYPLSILAPEGRNRAIFFDFLPILRPSGAK